MGSLWSERVGSSVFGFMLVLLLGTGCGSSQEDFVITPPVPVVATSRVVVEHPLARSLGSEIVALRFEAKDIYGAAVQAPLTFEKAPVIEFSVPQSTAVLEIYYLNSEEAVLGSFATTIDPSTNPVITLDNPAWVDSEGADPTVFRFALTGCNRLGFGELSDDNPSSANRAQLMADLTAIPNVVPPVSHFFFSGDLVTNLDPGVETLTTQLTAWLGIFTSSPLAQSSVELVPFTGNHEVLLSLQDPDTGEYVEFPNPATLPVWTSLMSTYLRGSNGPTTAFPNLDNLIEDQSQLSYTFQSSDVLFVILNTDTFIDLETLGDVPLNWLADQLNTAQNDPTVNHIFVMGHKPIIAPPGGGEAPGPGSIRAEEKEPLAQLLAAHSKVRGYLCAHAHLWEYSHLANGTPQLVAGNGGS